MIFNKIIQIQKPIYDFFDQKYIFRVWIIGFYFQLNFKKIKNNQ